MANINLNAALLGIFSSDRKAAKQRELQIAQTQYALDQQKLKEQYQLSQTLAQNKRAAQKLANQVTFRKKDAQNLVSTLDEAQQQIRNGVAKYGGNVMKYMAAEGNNIWSTAVGNYEDQISRMNTNEKEIAKYFETANSKNAHLLMQKDLIKAEKYINGKIDNFTFSGQLGEIDMNKVDESTASGRQITAEDILKYNSNIVLSNYMREHNLTDPNRVSNQDLLNYTNEKYLKSQPPRMGKKEGDHTVGGVMYETLSRMQDLNLTNMNLFDKKSVDNLFMSVEAENMRHGVDKGTKTETKRGMRIASSDRVFENYKQELTKAYYGTDGKFVNLESKGLFNRKGEKIEEDALFEMDQYDLELQGYNYAFKYSLYDQNTGEYKEQLAVITDDEEKNAELKDQLEKSGATPSMVLVAEFREDDFLRDDFYYDEVQLSESMLSKIQTDYQLKTNEFADKRNQDAARKNKVNNQTKYANNISNFLGFTDPGLVLDFQNVAIDELSPQFDAGGISNQMIIPLMSMIMVDSENQNDYYNKIKSVKQQITNPESSLTKALLGGSYQSLYNYMVSTGEYTEKDMVDFRQIFTDYSGLNSELTRK